MSKKKLKSNSDTIFLGCVLFWNSDSRARVWIRGGVRVRFRVRSRVRFGVRFRVRVRFKVLYDEFRS